MTREKTVLLFPECVVHSGINEDIVDDVARLKKFQHLVDRFHGVPVVQTKIFVVYISLIYHVSGLTYTKLHMEI